MIILYFTIEDFNLDPRKYKRRRKVALKHLHKFFLNFYFRAIGANGVSSNSQFAPYRVLGIKNRQFY